MSDSGKELRDLSGSLQDNTLYLAFYAPQVNDYHRALFVPCSATSGSLLHAVFSEHSQTWKHERRDLQEVTTSRTLVLLYAISALSNDTDVDQIEQILTQIKFDAAGRQGNDELGGYSCVLWTSDALSALLQSSAIILDREVGKWNANVSVAQGIFLLSPMIGLWEMLMSELEEILQEARISAGPEDARTMVGKDLGPLRITNRDS